MNRIMGIAMMLLDPECGARMRAFHVEKERTNKILCPVTLPMLIVRRDIIIFGLKGHRDFRS
jgi:hypothetical protein